MNNNAVILNSNENYNEFSEEFWSAVNEYFQDDRKNAYERLYVDYSVLENYEEWEEHYILIQQVFKDKGFTEDQVLLVDNTW